MLTDSHVLFKVVDEGMSYFIEFELDDTIENCLCNRSLIEFLTLFVVKTDDMDNYNLTLAGLSPTTKCYQQSSIYPSLISPKATTSITPALASVATTLESALTNKRAADTIDVRRRMRGR